MAGVEIHGSTSEAADVTALDARLDTVEAQQITDDSRLDTVEAQQITDDSRLDTIEAQQITDDSRLDTAESTLTSHGTRLTTLEADDALPGLLVPAGLGAWTTSISVAKRWYAVRFVPPRDITIASVSWMVDTQASTDQVMDYGIYSAALAQLRSTGATSGKLNSGGVKNCALTSPLALTKGTVYYSVFMVGTPPAAGTAFTPATKNLQATAAATVVELFSASAPDRFAAIKTEAGEPPLPDPIAFTSLASAANVPVLALKTT